MASKTFDKLVNDLINHYLENHPEFKKNHLKQYPELATSIPASGKIFDNAEIKNLIEAALEGWWTEGRWRVEFENKLKIFLGVKFVHACNSGSSANLLAFTTLYSPALGNKRIKKGDEVITVAATFPTTITPIVQNGCIPVFVDIDKETYNIKVSDLERAFSRKSRAVMLAHTMGNPFEVEKVLEFCRKHKLWLIEDNCDALGSKYKGKYTGTFGDIATLSFYPAHHITTAEGGAVMTNNAELSRIIVSLRDWGRHCWCPTGKDNTCGKRFGWKLGRLPGGYDHKYIYGEVGYNLKITDFQAAIGVAQMDKLPEFIKIRKRNFDYLYNQMKQFQDYFFLPKATEGAEPSWFGFLLSVKDNKINREDLLRYLEKNRIATRLLFAGNIVKQPCFVDNKGLKYRAISNLENTDFIMNNTFWIGIYPFVNQKMINKITSIFKDYFVSRR